MSIESGEVAVKEIVVSYIVDSSVSFLVPFRNRLFVKCAHQTKCIRGSPGGWLDFSDEPTKLIPLHTTNLSFFELTSLISHNFTIDS